MSVINNVLKVLRDVQDKIDDAIIEVDSLEDEEAPSPLPLDELNELIGMGLVPGVLIQIVKEDGKVEYYQFIRYGDELMAEFKAAELQFWDDGDWAEECSKHNIIKSNLESLTDKKKVWTVVVGGEIQK